MNHVELSRFSNPKSKLLYEQEWPADKKAHQLYHQGMQCGGCSFFAPLNADWGLCCFKKSEHFTETVFEHFTCSKYVHESWDSHSFKELQSGRSSI